MPLPHGAETLALCLDIAGRTGFALGKGRAVVHSGIIKAVDPDSLPGPGNAARRLINQLNSLCGKHGFPGHVVYEQPLNANAAAKYMRNTPDDLALLHRLTGAVDGWCADRRIPATEVTVWDHRKATTGKAVWRGPYNSKDETLKAVNLRKLRSYRVLDHNEADALSVFVWAAEYVAGIHAGEFSLTATR